MTLGRMDRKITIQQKTVANDATGQPVETWTDLATDIRAEYIPAAGREFWGARQTSAVVVASFRIHYRADVTRVMRVQFDGDTYDIADVGEDRRFSYKQFTLIRGEARVA